MSSTVFSSLRSSSLLMLVMASFSLLYAQTARSDYEYLVPPEASPFIHTTFEHSGWVSTKWNGPGLTMYDISLLDLFFLKRVHDPAGSGRKVLFWPIEKHTHSISRLESRNVDSTEAWAQYKIYIPSSVGNYNIGNEQDDSNKLPGFTAGDSGSGDGGPKDGLHGWSARVGWKVDADNVFHIGYYTYHMDRPTQYGEWLNWDITLERNQWYTITEHVKANTLIPGNGPNGFTAANDGVLEAWVDDQQVMSRTNLRFTAIPDFSRVRAFWLTVYFGGPLKAPHNMGFYLDDINVYRMIDPPPVVIEKSEPNPAHANDPIFLDLQINETGPYHLFVSDILNRRIIYQLEGFFEKSDQIQKVPIQMNGAAAGIYVPYLTFGGYKFGSSGSNESANSKAMIVIQ